MNFGRRPSRSSRSSVSSSTSTRMPSLVHLDLHDVGLVGAERRHRARVGRRLGDDHVARVDERLADEVDHLLAAGRDEQLAFVDRHALGRHHLGDAVRGAGEALGRPVLERSRARLLARRVAISDAYVSGGKRRRVGQPAGERDHLGALGQRHQVAHRGGLHDLRALREQARRSARGRAPSSAAACGRSSRRLAAVGMARTSPRRPGSLSRSAIVMQPSYRTA